ncbi:MAG TPA: hypothetical protein ENJ19_00465 [Gammaproteobacteria bacterium]|nr:hypothetical protein [Gammaproteobacteria bacterium]
MFSFPLCRSAAVLMAGVLLGACAVVQLGRDFPLTAFTSKVERGVTTRQQVQDWLGPPAGTGVEVARDGSRYDLWTYYWGKGKLPKMANARFKMLQVKFNRRGVVQSYNWSGEQAP